MECASIGLQIKRIFLYTPINLHLTNGEDIRIISSWNTIEVFRVIQSEYTNHQIEKIPHEFSYILFLTGGHKFSHEWEYSYAQQ